MIKAKVPYKDLDQTMQGIRLQIVDSLQHFDGGVPKFRNPRELFKWCKQNTTYHKDPKGIELLQSVQTLFNDNYWGISGAGDCDCFTILTIFLCIENGWNDNYIYLCGRNKKKAVHIYSGVDFDGERYTLDLTNPYINIERPYPYCQIMAV